MSHHEFFLDGVKRHVIVVDPDDAMDKLAQWTRCYDPTSHARGHVALTDLTVHWLSPGTTDWHPLDFVALEILLLLGSISDGATDHRCAICDTRFTLARLPLRFISCWPLGNSKDVTDGDTWGMCSACSVRPTLLWDDALVMFERKRIELLQAKDELVQRLLRAKLLNDEDRP